MIPMRKRSISFILTILAGLQIANAQFDATAKKILDKVSANYQTFNTIQADVLLKVENPNEKAFTQEGKLELERMSGKFKISLGSQEIICDGKTQWSVLKDQGEVQVNDADKDESSLNPATIFTFYKKGYTGKSKGISRVGNKVLDVIALVPTDTRDNVANIDLRVDRATNLIYDATVNDKNGGKFTYTIKKLSVNVAIPYSVFVFHKSLYPTMEVVDLR